MQSCSRPTYSALLPSATCPPRKVVHPHQTHGPSPSESIMSKSFCKTQLLGFTGADPILSTLSNGTATASINIATSVDLFDPTVSRFIERTIWHRVLAFGPPGRGYPQKRYQGMPRLYRRGVVSRGISGPRQRQDHLPYPGGRIQRHPSPGPAKARASCAACFYDAATQLAAN